MSVNPYLSGVRHLEEGGEVKASYVINLLTTVELCILVRISLTKALYWVLSMRSASMFKDGCSITTSKRGHVVYIAKGRRRLGVGNSGLPTERNLYGNGSAIVGVKKIHTKVPKSVMSPKSEAHVGQGSLGELVTYNSKGKCNNGYDLLCQIKVLQSAYMKIKSQPGNMTPGSDKETLDGISEEWFENTSQNLVKEQFSFRPTRRVYIPKANGKMRPLGVASPRDKIVQEAFRAILEEVLEKKFSPRSHGFRPTRGCHSALAEIRYWNGVKWYIEGDIKAFFYSIDFHIMENLLRKHFDDQRLIDLFWKMVRAGYVEFGENKSSIIGVPQGGIASPILSNLVLNELDLYIDKLIQQRLRVEKNDGRPHTLRNPAYYKFDNRIQTISKIEKRLRSKGERVDQALIIERDELVKQRAETPSTVPNGDLAKFYYVRYADDWLIGVAGSVEFAEKLKADIAAYLKEVLKLELSLEKTHITNASKKKAYFLGTEIQRTSSVKGEIKRFTNSKGHSQRVPTTSTILTAPINEIVKKFTSKGVVKWNSKEMVADNLEPLPILKWVNLPIRDIILRYRMILNGLLNYYSFVKNKPNLIIIYWILRVSLAKTLATKLKLGTVRKVYLKFGINIQYNIPSTDKCIDFAKPNLEAQTQNFKGNTDFTDNLRVIDWKLRTINFFNYVCASCGSSENLQVHHLKHIKTIDANLNTFDKQMAAINRKQITLCSKCHHKVHIGKYDGMTLKELKTIKAK